MGVDNSELSDKLADMWKRKAEFWREFWRKKGVRKYALYNLYECLLTLQASGQSSVLSDMESHFAEDSIQRHDRFSAEIAYYGGLGGDSFETLDALGILRAKDGNPRVYCENGVCVYAHGVYRLSVDAEVYMEMNNIWREVFLMQRGNDL